MAENFEGWLLELADCTNTLLNEISRKETTRESLASTYGLAIISSEEVDFKRVNAAIIERWSEYALNYIITKAWKMIDERV
jgi:hypothetical protein